MQKEILKVENLIRRFGNTTALNNLSFKVGEEEIFGILGPDGAGKSTLLRVLAGLDRGYQGNVTILDSVPGEQKLKGKIAYMPQRFSLYPDLTVIENLRFFSGVFKKGDPKQLDRLLRIAGLHSVQNRLAGNLSGGMKKKLILITVLVSRPQVLFLDEPNTGVDPVSRREIWDLLFEFNKQGITVIIATSYSEEAERCDRVMIMYSGKALAIDTPSNLTQKLKDRIWQVPTSQTDRLISDFGSVFFIQKRGTFSRLLIRPKHTIEEAKNLLTTRRVDAIPVEPTLEDVLFHSKLVSQ